MQQRYSVAWLALCLCSLPICVHADEFDTWYGHDEAVHSFRTQPGFHAVERLGITLGGDILSRVAHLDGTIREITAGGLYQAGLGVLYQYAALPCSIELTLNYHYDSDYNGNENSAFRRVPLEGLLYYTGIERLHLGMGMRYVYSPRVTSSLNGVSERITFQNAHGRILEIGYQVRPGGWVYLRHVQERYFVESYSTTGSTPTVSATAPYDGSHFGLFISYEL